MKLECEQLGAITDIFDIVDLTKQEVLPCDDAIETFYEDENYLYQFSCVKSEYVLAHFKHGTELTVSQALKNGKITIADLDDWEIEYIKVKKYSRSFLLLFCIISAIWEIL